MKFLSKYPRGRPTHGWDNIKTNLTEMGEGVAWIHLVQYRVQWWGFCENNYDPSSSKK
jgi:hypothetical protein